MPAGKQERHALLRLLWLPSMPSSGRGAPFLPHGHALAYSSRAETPEMNFKPLCCIIVELQG
eukprot:517557-Pelagomonas_calceolata.AAC.2